MTRTMWVTWVTFGGSYPQTKLYGCDPELASGKWVNFGSDECTEISLVWNHLIFILSFLKHVVSKDFIFKKPVRIRFCVLPRMKKFMVNIFYVMLHKLLLKVKTSTCGSQVGHTYVGHIPIAICVSGSNGLTGVTDSLSTLIAIVHYMQPPCNASIC